jgi:hypothetical protein
MRFGFGRKGAGDGAQTGADRSPGPSAAASAPDSVSGYPPRAYSPPGYSAFGSSSSNSPAEYDDEPGHTRSFDVSVAVEGRAGASEPGAESATEPRGSVTTYRAGQSHPQVGATRLAWRPLLAGIYRHPVRTFAQMRWHQVWGPALIASAVYGALAVFGFSSARAQVVNSTFSLALTIILSSAVGIILAGLMFGGVTHALARQLGGDGAWAPTIGFAMLIVWTTDVPRLLFSLFLPSANAFVQFLGWGTWLLCAWLLSAMIRQLHDLPWGKAAAAASLQLIALLLLIKLPILG